MLEELSNNIRITPAVRNACFAIAGAIAGRKVIMGGCYKACAFFAKLMDMKEVDMLNRAGNDYLLQAKKDAFRDLTAATALIGFALVAGNVETAPVDIKTNPQNLKVNNSTDTEAADNSKNIIKIDQNVSKDEWFEKYVDPAIKTTASFAKTGWEAAKPARDWIDQNSKPLQNFYHEYYPSAKSAYDQIPQVVTNGAKTLFAGGVIVKTLDGNDPLATFAAVYLLDQASFISFPGKVTNYFLNTLKGAYDQIPQVVADGARTFFWYNMINDGLGNGLPNMARRFGTVYILNQAGVISLPQKVMNSFSNAISD